MNETVRNWNSCWNNEQCTDLQLLHNVAVSSSNQQHHAASKQSERGGVASTQPLFILLLKKVAMFGRVAMFSCNTRVFMAKCCKMYFKCMR